MKITILALLLAGCVHDARPKQDKFPGPQLGESRKSPGADPSKPAPITTDDPKVMNVSASINPAQLGRASATPAPVPQRAPTTSTPVQQPTDIAPPTTTPSPMEPQNPAPPPPPEAQAPTPAPAPAPSSAPVTQ
jgi:hypothetical protein